MEQVPARLNKFYHTGFKYESSRQFCSKFVFDIYKEALCIPVGDAPRDKCAHFREINGIAAAFHYLQKNYNPTVSFFL